jgi:hypothetical protein
VNDDDEIPSSDELLAIGFEFCDNDAMHQYVGVNNSGPKVVIVLHGNNRRDNFMMAKSLSLHWTVQFSPNKISGTFSIRDNPTLGQIKDLLKALKGE